LSESATDQKRDQQTEVCATCRAACPVHTDTRAYTELISQGRYEEAFEKIRQFNPFPTVCGLICHHPCEQECRRQFVDQPVALRNLKRFAVEQSLTWRREHRAAAAVTQSQTIGVVGSGPAGLTVAHDIIEAGYAVTVYEALPRPGGFLACGIPKYRLPDADLQQDLDDITALGIKIRTGVRVGEDITLDDLREKHDAVVIAVGLSESRPVPMEGSDHSDVLLAIPFLRETALGNPPAVKEDVIVIGGGNVAIDCARTAARLGAKTVKMICLEDEEEMPAWEWECREALEEDIEIIYRQGPTKVLTDSNAVVGLQVRAVERVFDDEGRFSPTYFDDRLSVVDGRTIIVSIGQRSDLSLVQDTPVKLTERGLLQFAAHTMSTSEKGVFACGEVVTGPGAAIEAVASGHRAAWAVLHYLESGELAPVEDEEIEEVGALPDEVIEKVKRMERVAMPAMSPEERRRSFAQFEFGYDEHQALREARRCVSCAAGAVVEDEKCAACLTCLRICPFGVPVVEDVARMRSEMCQSCGLCVAECPTAAISIRRFAVGDIRARAEKLMEDAPGQVTRVEYVCAQDAETRDELRDRTVSMNGDLVAVVPVTCAARVDEVDMMKPFELGAGRVIVRMCSECRYRGADDRLTKRVGRTQEILDAVGVGGDKLSLEWPAEDADP